MQSGYFPFAKKNVTFYNQSKNFWYFKACLFIDWTSMFQVLAVPAQKMSLFEIHTGKYDNWSEW